ncbi:putative mitochondrial protein [Sesbania bispinosa]|nr:putative mitochondrial protein [Sesbania bispinosa]
MSTIPMWDSTSTRKFSNQRLNCRNHFLGLFITRGKNFAIPLLPQVPNCSAKGQTPIGYVNSTTFRDQIIRDPILDIILQEEGLSPISRNKLKPHFLYKTTIMQSMK